MVAFVKYPKVHDVEKGTTLYADVVNHCQDYASFLVVGSKITSCHECTHGCNNDIRNRVGGNVNGFYLGQDRAIVIPEPKCRKRDAAGFIPESLRAGRFAMYVTGQSEWDAQPLYLFDELVAYVNGAWAALDLKRQEQYTEGSRVIEGPVEFVSYAAAVLLAADKVGDLSQLLCDFSRWLFRHAYNSYFECLKEFDPFDEQDRLYRIQKDGAEWAAVREFLKTRLYYSIPSGFEDEDWSRNE